MITCCAQNNKPSLGVSICFQDFSVLSDVKDMYLKTKLSLVNNLLTILNTKKELKHLYYFYGKNLISAGEFSRLSDSVVFCQ